MSYLEQLIEGIEVEWSTLGDPENVEIANGGRKPVKASLRIAGDIPYYGANNVQDYVEGYTHDGSYILIAEDGTASVEDYSIQHAKGRFWANNHVHVIRGTANLKTRFIYHYLKTLSFIPFLSGGGRAKLTKGKLCLIPIPIPPLSVQKEIVRILDTFTGLTAELTTELIARKKQFTYYHNQLLSFEGENVEWKTLQEVCLNISAGGDVPKNCAKGQLTPSEKFPYPIYANATGSKGLYGYTDGYKIGNKSVTISARGAKIGYHTVREAKFTAIIRLIVLEPNENFISPKFLDYALEMTPISGTKGGIPQLIVPTVKKLSIPVPSIETQERIVSILDKFETLVTSKNEGLPAEIAMRQKQYEYYRDMLLTFPKDNTAV